MTPDIVVAREMPFPVEVMVFEEDTYLLLSAGNNVRDIREPISDLQSKAAKQTANVVGDIVSHGSRWFAIVHDTDQDTSFKKAWVVTALDNLCFDIERVGLGAIGIQPLGCQHGPESMSDAVGRIRSQRWPGCLHRIWVM